MVVEKYIRESVDSISSAGLDTYIIYAIHYKKLNTTEEVNFEALQISHSYNLSILPDQENSRKRSCMHVSDPQSIMNLFFISRANSRLPGAFIF